MGFNPANIFGSVSTPTATTTTVKEESTPATKQTTSTTSDSSSTSNSDSSLKKKSAYALSMSEQGDQSKKPLYRGSIYGQKTLSS